MENVFEILKDLPKAREITFFFDSGKRITPAGEKAGLAEKKIIWESKRKRTLFSTFSKQVTLKNVDFYEIREQQVFCDIIGGSRTSGHLWQVVTYPGCR
ncbi:MAG: hypothetical protein ACLR2O_05515 [Coprococcus sp.]